MVQDRFGPLLQRKTLIPFMQLIHPGFSGVDEAAAGRDAQQDHAMGHFSYERLQKFM